jgi:hypothetical protein
MGKIIDKHSSEKSVVGRLFNRLQRLGCAVPTKIEFSDRPDAVVFYPDKTVGLEATSVTYQEVFRAMNLHKELFPPSPTLNSVITTIHLVDGERRRSNDEIKNVMFDPSSPWKNSEQVILEWGEKIEKRWKLKLKKLNQPGFRTFDENWLLIHEEFGVTSQRDVRPMCQQLANFLTVDAGYANEFDLVFINSFKCLFKWQSGKLSWNYSERERSYLTF